MKSYTSLQEALKAQDTGEVFVEIRRIQDDEWNAYEQGDDVPALPLQDHLGNDIPSEPQPT